jgi:solute:Na+ symporter, SSS family
VTIAHSSPPTFAPHTLTWLDYLLLTLYFAVNLGIGWQCARRKQNSSSDFFLGGGRIKWWAAAISLFATSTSSISFMALPAKSYTTDWLPAMSAPAQGIAGMLVAVLFVRVLRQLNLTTVFGYLEERFSRRVRWIAAGLAVLLKIFGRMSVVMLLPALALSTVTGLNVYISILLMGAVTTLYAIEGGFEAVVWTDVLQSTVLAGGVAIALVYLAHGVNGGLAGIVQVGAASGKLQLVSWDWDLTQPTMTVFAGMFVATIFIYTADQPLMQRVFAATDLRSAQRTLVFGHAIGMISSLVFFFVGTALWVFYRAHPERLAAGLSNDVIFPYFIANELPPGVVGLIVAGLFAVSMGALSSAMNATAAVLVTDFQSVVRPDATETDRVRLARRATLVCGVIATAMAALLATQNSTSLWDTFLKLIALIGGGIPGIFALGLLTRRANAPGVIAGALASIGFTAWVQYATNVSVFFHGFIALASCVVVGYIASLVLGRWCRPVNLQGLTLWDRAPKGTA